MKKIIYILLGLIVIAGVVGFFYYRGTIFSKEILQLQIKAQDSVKAGDEIEYKITYKNNGKFTLEKPKIFFDFPPNTLLEDNKLLFTKDLEDINPGDEDVITFKGRLLGKEGDVKTAKVILSYVPHNLSARYEAEATFDTKIQEVPIDLVFDLSPSIEQGREMSFSINYASHIDYPMENLSLKLDPIDGFTIKSAVPSSLDKIEWKVGTLNKDDNGKIKITGLISANPQSHLNFVAKIGMWQNGGFVVIKEINQEVEVIRPQLSITQLINGSLDYQPSRGETLNYEIGLRNIGTSAFSNLFLISRLEGSAFDFTTLQSGFGQFTSGDNLLAFDLKQILDSRHLDSQEEIKLNFSIKLKDGSESSDTTIKNKINVLSLSQEFTNTIK